MFNFREFLKEEYRPLSLTEEVLLEMAAATKETANDDKGKMHELLLAKYLHPEQTLPEHHRSESENEDHAGTPVQVHNRLKEKIGPHAYNEIDAHAQQTARAIKRHFETNGHQNVGENISNVFWTSNRDTAGKAGDHEKTTGVKDQNSNADLIARIADKAGNVKHVGISAKYGSREPNYANPGLDSLEKSAGMPKGTLNKHMEVHRQNMEKLGYQGSADTKNIQTKIDEMGIDDARSLLAKHEGTLASGGKLKGKDKIMHEQLSEYVKVHDGLPKAQQAEFEAKAKNRASIARESNLSARKEMAKEFHKHLSNKTPQELGDILRKAVSPQTHIPHIVAHSKVRDDGSADSIVKPMHSLADDHFAQFDMSTLRPHVGAGTNVTFKANSLKSGKPMNVGMINIKSSSGAHKGAVGSLKLKAD
jgi:hypothetical protein